MEQYQPPFHITNQMLTAAARIAEKAGRLSLYRSLETRPYLRRNNRIRSVHSSLAIEANSLSPEDVRSVIGGKTVIGPEKEIREVKNAWRAYELLGQFDPYSLQDLKRLHGILTEGTVEESGMFRSRNEGVFQGDRCIFMAPPPQFVAEQMESLFDWMLENRDAVHPLILSNVFHYEFVFIHPFADGNGRMARLWQTALLAEWNPLFRYLPLESQILAFQQEYYDAIALCRSAGNSDAFITFMLGMTERALDRAAEQLSEKNAEFPLQVRQLLDTMEPDMPYTGAMLMEKLGLKNRDHFRKTYLQLALQQGLIERGIPDKPTSRNQTYIKR